MIPAAEDLIQRYTKQALRTEDKVLAAQLWEKIKYIKNEEKKKNAARST